MPRFHQNRRNLRLLRTSEAAAFPPEGRQPARTADQSMAVALSTPPCLILQDCNSAIGNFRLELRLRRFCAANAPSDFRRSKSNVGFSWPSGSRRQTDDFGRVQRLMLVGTSARAATTFSGIAILAAQRTGGAAKIRHGPLRGNPPPPDAAPSVCDTRPTHALDQRNRPIWYRHRACAATLDRHPDHTSSPSKSVGSVKAQEISRHYSPLGVRALESNVSR
jgi:hypothetical protein